MAAATHRDTSSDRLRLLEHVALCPLCRRDFDLLRTVVDAGARRRWLATAGPLAAACLIGLAVWSGARRSGPAAFPGPEKTPTPPAGASRPDSFKVAWRPLSGATRYRVEMVSPSGHRFASVETSDTMLTLSRASTAPGDEPRLSVRALMRDGTVMDLPAGALQRIR